MRPSDSQSTRRRSYYIIVCPQARSQFSATKGSYSLQPMDFVGPEGAMEFSPAADAAHRGMLEDAIFPAFGSDAASPSVESPEEMQKNDPLGTQIWKLYSRAKTQLPNAERMENLTWRMMAMNMRRAELDRNKGYGCRHTARACSAASLGRTFS